MARKVSCVFLIAVTVFFFFAAVENAVCTQEKSPLELKLERIQELTLTSHILQKDESEELSNIISDVSAKERDIAVLRAVSLRVANKVVTDRGNLQVMLFDIEKLAADEYSSSVGKMKPADVKPCFKELGDLLVYTEARRVDIDEKESKVGAADYLKILERNGVFLTGTESEAKTVPAVWDGIKKQIEEAFPLWDERYNVLMREIADSNYKAPDEVLDKSELKFVEVFGRVKAYYLKLNGSLVMCNE